jgi:hypothetical protein
MEKNGRIYGIILTSLFSFSFSQDLLLISNDAILNLKTELEQILIWCQTIDRMERMRTTVA